jgi:hypothetical protein
MNRTIAIQSWCYRHFKEVPSFIEQLKSTGVSATELCGVHANIPRRWDCVDTQPLTLGFIIGL